MNWRQRSLSDQQNAAEQGLRSCRSALLGLRNGQADHLLRNVGVFRAQASSQEIENCPRERVCFSISTFLTIEARQSGQALANSSLLRIIVPLHYRRRV